MRLVPLVVMTFLMVLGSGAPAFPGEVTVKQGTKTYSGWTNSWGGIMVANAKGKIIMRGRLNRTGSIEIIREETGETFVGQVNPMGYGLLFSSRGDSLRVEVER
jgi:hypothetical protein